MYITRRGEVVHVDIINKGYDNSIVKIKHNDKEEIVKNCDIFKTTQEARMSIREYRIAKKFKKKHSDKNGVMTCNHCKKKGKDLTLDHKVSLHSRGGRKEIRKDIKLWEECWNDNNLQILCSSCNKIKSNMSEEKFNRYISKIDRKGKILAYRKNKLMTKNVHKVGFGISTSDYNKHSKIYSYDVQIRLAKMDSRVLYKELIL